MAKIDEVKGVRAKNKKPLVIPLPYAPENQFISRDEFIRRRKIQNEAKEAAEKAKNEVLAKYDIPSQPSDSQKTVDKKSSGSQGKKIGSLRKRLALAESKVQEFPSSLAWKKRASELSQELEALESEEE